MWVKDFRRTIDYLESRDDMSAKSVGLIGYSWGSEMAPIALSVEPRVAAAVLNVAGIWMNSTPLPEADTYNYLTHVRTPTLLLSG